MENESKSNLIYGAKIIDYTHTGLGIVKNQKQVIFVEDALIGEVVDINIYKYEKKIAYAKVNNYVEKSKNRVIPKCQYYNICGGCNIMHLNLEEQMKFKKKIIKNIFYKAKLSNISLLENFDIILNDKPFEYRNKVIFSLYKNTIRDQNKNNNYISLGFNKKKTNDIVIINKCHLIPPNMNNISQKFIKYLNEQLDEKYTSNINKINNIIKILNKLTVRENQEEEILLALEVSENILKSKIESKYQELIKIIEDFYKQNQDLINFSIIYKFKIIKEYKKKNFIFKLENKNFLIGPISFFQVNTLQTIKLYNSIKGLINKESVNILDAYSGVGSIGIYIYEEKMNLYGFEIIEEAVYNSMENLKLNNVKSGKYSCANLDKYIEKISDLNINFDTIIIDPPRKGISQEFMKFLKEFLVQEIIYVSCSPQTLARDINLLKDYYNITFFEAYDMFSQTNHVEAICKLELK